MAGCSGTATHLARSKFSSGNIVELATLDAVFLVIGQGEPLVNFGLFFHNSADQGRLIAALERVLEFFEPAAGRMVRRGDRLVIECNNAGVPLTFETRHCASPAPGSPYDDDLFDFALGAMPPDTEASMGKPLLRVRITTFTDGQLFGVSANHVLGDAASFNLLMVAWGEAYRNIDDHIDIDHDRLRFYPETLAGLEDTPRASDATPHQDWLLLHQSSPPSTVITSDEPPAWSVVSWFRTPEEVALLKKRYDQLAEGQFVSSVDVLTSEIIQMCRFEACSVRVNVIKQFRNELCRRGYFGNAVLVLGIDVPNTHAAAGALRKVVPACQSEAFVRWKLGQSICGFELSGNHLSLNSWFRSIEPELITFEGSAAHLNFALKQYYDDYGKTGLMQPSAHILPQGSGFRVNLCVPRSVARALSKEGVAHSCIDLAL